MSTYYWASLSEPNINGCGGGGGTMVHLSSARCFIVSTYGRMQYFMLKSLHAHAKTTVTMVTFHMIICCSNFANCKFALNTRSSKVIVAIVVNAQRYILYSGKFSYGANFRIFRMLHPLYENKNCENLNVRIFSLLHVTFDLCAHHGHTRSLAAGAKCKASSLNNVSLSVLCQGVETEWPFWSQWTAISDQMQGSQWC